MAYNHAKEELIFANHWAKLRDEYLQAGMSEEAIQAMYDFDREVFNGNRSYSEHTVRLLLEDEAEDEDEFAYAQALLNYHITEYTLRRAIREGALPCRIIGRTHLIAWANFERWLFCVDGSDNEMCKSQDSRDFAHLTSSVKPATVSPERG